MKKTTRFWLFGLILLPFLISGCYSAKYAGSIADPNINSLYKGQVKGNKPHGNGAAKGKYSYKGEFSYGKKHGEGKYTAPGKFTYKGGFKEDKFEGSGKMTGVVIT